MSGTEKNGSPGGRMNTVLPVRQDILLCAAWIAAILLAGILLWLGTASYRQRLLTEEVNRRLEQNGDPRRIGFPLVPGNTGLPGAPGTWFALDGSSGRACVFTMLRSANAALCVAFTGTDGKVTDIVPLGGNAGQFTADLPLYRFYADRIERAWGGVARGGAARGGVR